MQATIRRLSPLVWVAALFAALTVLAPAAADAAPGYGKASITASPSSGPAGSSTTVSGQNFNPNATVTLTFHSAPSSLGTAHTDAAGRFSTRVTIPSGARKGHHTIFARDNGSPSRHAHTGFLVTTRHGAGGVTVSDPTPPEGGSITISGQGCTPGATITITLDNGDTLATTKADSSGAYSVVVKLPSGVTGHHTITVSGAGCSGVVGINIQSGGLATTGVAVIGIGAVGVVLLVGGGLMLLAGRRRKTAPAA
jgi:hypothetical protein